jgi:AcrR family transcriptional regulator
MDVPSNNTKYEIAVSALELFLTQGYEATTMKQLSERTGKSYGNINYYFRRKEDILIFLHRRTIEIFMKDILRDCAELENPWMRYLTAHIAYLHMVIKEKSILDLYISATRLPTVRLDYIQIFYELYLQHFDVEKENLDKRDVFMKVVTLCGGEFEAITLYFRDTNIYNIGYLLEYPIRSFLLLFSFPPDEMEQAIEKSFRLGREMSDRYWSIKKDDVLRGTGWGNAASAQG